MWHGVFCIPFRHCTVLGGFQHKPKLTNLSCHFLSESATAITAHFISTIRLLFCRAQRDGLGEAAVGTPTTRTSQTKAFAGAAAVVFHA